MLFPLVFLLIFSIPCIMYLQDTGMSEYIGKERYYV
nr:MAG TPA: hypothetical protein [Caudoviricetes sp.]